MNGSKKKLLIMIDWFAPGYKAGGPVQSCVNICRLLSKQYDIYVFTTDTDHGEALPYENIKANEWIKNEELGVQVFYAAKKTISLTQVKKQIVSVNADSIYLNLLFSYYFTLYPLWLKLRNAISSKVVLCPRGTLFESALSVKRFKKIPVINFLRWSNISRHIIFHATNQREKNAILNYFPGSEVLVANNLPDIDQPVFSGVEKKAGSLKCIFIARIVPIKNLLFLLHCLKDAAGDITLSIIGPAEAAGYWNECKKMAEQLPANIKVNYLGAKESTVIKQILLQQHLFILPTAGENFGHAIFESLLAGRPVLISDQTPWGQIAETQAGWSFALNEPGKFTETINFLCSCNQEQYDIFAAAAWQYAHRFINDPNLVKPYQTIFE